MTPIETDISEYLLWMQIHNYAQTTIAGRVRYLGYLRCFLAKRGIETSEDVTLEDLLVYQHVLFSHRKSDGIPLTVATQVQRLVPVAQFFSWLRRTGRLDVNPAADMTMPRPDRRLPEATLSAIEMAAVLSAPLVSKPLGLRDRAVLEVFYSCGLRRNEAPCSSAAAKGQRTAMSPSANGHSFGYVSTANWFGLISLPSGFPTISSSPRWELRCVQIGSHDQYGTTSLGPVFKTR
jgi:site-specific recombinase XerC